MHANYLSIKLLARIIVCQKKVKYGHEETALNAASKMNKKKNEPFEAYECEFCQLWHIGHPRGWKRENARTSY